MCAGSVLTQQNVHDHKKLLDALVLAEILATLHEKGVVTLIIPTNDQTFGATHRGHHLYLQGMDSQLYTEQRDFTQNQGAIIILLFNIRRPTNTYPFVKACYLCMIFGQRFGSAIILSYNVRRENIFMGEINRIFNGYS